MAPQLSNKEWGCETWKEYQRRLKEDEDRRIRRSWNRLVATAFLSGCVLGGAIGAWLALVLS
jgi:hypothetical protein